MKIDVDRQILHNDEKPTFTTFILAPTIFTQCCDARQLMMLSSVENLSDETYYIALD